MESEDRKPIFTKKLILGILAVVLLALIVFLLLKNCSGGGDYKVSHISISPTSFGLEIEQTMQVFANVLPSDAKDRRVTWSSSNPSVATVDQLGTVTGISEGTATITATAMDGSGITGQTYVTVGASVPKLEQLQLNKSSYNIKVGKTAMVEVTPVPVAANMGDLIYYIDNTSIATIDAYGVIKGISVGTTTITVTSPIDNISATAVIKVSKNATTVVVPPTTIKVEAIDLPYDGCYQIKVGTKYTINAQIKPVNATDQQISWETSDEKVAKIDGKTGEIIGVKAGTATIKATAVSSKVYNIYTIKVVTSGAEGSCKAVVPSQPGTSSGETKSTSTTSGTITKYGIKTESKMDLDIEGSNKTSEVTISGNIVANNQFSNVTEWLDSASCYIEIGGGIANFRYTATVDEILIHRDRAIVKIDDPSGVNVCITTYSSDINTGSSNSLKDDATVTQTQCKKVCGINSDLKIELDDEKPTCKIEKFEFETNDTYTVTVNADDSFSGLSSISFNGNGKKTNGDTNKKEEFSIKIKDNKSKSYTATVHDKAGNVGTCTVDFSLEHGMTETNVIPAKVKKIDSIIDKKVLHMGDTAQITSETTDDAGATYVVETGLTYAVNDGEVISIDSSGTVKVLKSVDTTVTITVTYTDSTNSSVKNEIKVSIKKGVSPECKIELGDSKATNENGEWYTGEIGASCYIPEDEKSITISHFGICFNTGPCEPKLESVGNRTAISKGLNNITGEGFIYYRYKTSNGYEYTGKSDFIKVDNQKPGCSIRINGGLVEYVINTEASGYESIKIEDESPRTFEGRTVRTINPIAIPYNNDKERKAVVKDLVGLEGQCSRTINDNEANEMNTILTNYKSDKFFIETSGEQDSFWYFDGATGKFLLRDSGAITLTIRSYSQENPTTSIIDAIKKFDNSVDGYKWENNNENLVKLSSTSGASIKAIIQNTQVARKGGTATITAHSVANPSVSAKVVINVPAASIPPTSISIGYIPSELSAGLGVDVAIYYAPYNTTIKEGKLISTDPNVIKVDGNRIVAQKGGVGGTAEIYAKYGNLESRRTTVTVLGVDKTIPSISISEPKYAEVLKAYYYYFKSEDSDSNVKLYYNTQKGTSCTPTEVVGEFNNRTVVRGGQIEENGIYTACAYAEDEAGNKTETLKKTFTIAGLPKIIKATFNCTGGSGSNTVSCETKPGQSDCSVTAPSCSRDGYNFKGWATSPIMKFGSVTSNFTIPRDGNVFYATWQSKSVAEYTVEFDCNKGSGSTSRKCSPVSGVCTVEPPICTRTGYTQIAWGNSATATSGTSIGPILINSTTKGNTYYAIWKQKAETTKIYTVIFDCNGGKTVDGMSTVPRQCTVKEGSTECLVAGPVCKKEGYTFTGWGGIATLNTSIMLTKSGNTYRASWKEVGDKLTAIFNCPGSGSTESCTPVSGKTACTINNVPRCSKDGYEFIGWNLKQNQTTGVSSIFLTSTLNKVPTNYYPAFVRRTPSCSSISVTSAGTIIASVNDNGSAIKSYGWSGTKTGSGTKYNGTYKLAIFDSGNYTLTVKNDYGQATCSISVTKNSSCPDGYNSTSNGKCCPDGYSYIPVRSETQCLKIGPMSEATEFTAWTGKTTITQTQPSSCTYTTKTAAEDAKALKYCVMVRISVKEECYDEGLYPPCYLKSEYTRSVSKRECLTEGTSSFGGYCYYTKAFMNKSATYKAN